MLCYSGRIGQSPTALISIPAILEIVKPRAGGRKRRNIYLLLRHFEKWALDTLPEQVNKNVSLFCFDSVVGIILFIPTVGRCNEWSTSLTRKAGAISEGESKLVKSWVPPTGSCSENLDMTTR